MTNTGLILGGVAGLAAIGATIGLVTPRQLSVSHIELSTPLQGNTFLHMSDYHYELLRVSPDKLKKAISDINPTAILFTGDLFYKAQNSTSALNHFKQIVGDIPVIMCLGNHEYKAYRVDTPGPDDPQNVDEYMCRVKEMGFIIGRNEIVNQFGYNFVLLDDFRENRQNLDSYTSTIHALLSSVAGTPTIVLCHSPATAGLIAKLPLEENERPSMVLCGHYHGGQVDLPGHPEYYHFRSEMKHLPGHFRGLKVHNHVPVYISRGLGSVVVPIRFASTPEITVIKA